MRKQITLLISLLIFTTTYCNLDCDKILPNTTEDCYNITTRCCYLSVQGSKEIPPRCSLIQNDTTTAILETYSYNVNCKENTTSLSNQTLNFTLGNLTLSDQILPFQSCGPIAPTSLKDCVDASTNSSSCCFASFGGMNYCYDMGTKIEGYTFYSGITLDCYSRIYKNVASMLVIFTFAFL